MHGYIYKTVDSKTNKIYIGQKRGSFNPSYTGSGVIIKKVADSRRHDLHVELVAYLPNQEQLDEFEKHLISKYREIVGRQGVYNISDGGEGSKGHTHIHTKEAKEKISARSMGINNPMYGKTHSQELIQRFSLQRSGKHVSIKTEFRPGHLPIHACKTKEQFPNLSKAGNRSGKRSPHKVECKCIVCKRKKLKQEN